MISTRYDRTRGEIADLLADEPAYRLDQIWEGLYRDCAEPEDWTTLPKTLREHLAADLPRALTEVTRSLSDDGQTVKYLWELIDGHRIETVLMLYPDRATVCVSSQAGCAMACSFCATGQAGFSRHLGVGEIVEQVALARREALALDRRVSNIVFMGMGEPLANTTAVFEACRRINGDLGISARSITVSTVGIIPGIRALAEFELPVNLAVSLHSAADSSRDPIVPINRRYPLDDLVEVCGEYLRERRRRVSFEWALIDGVNDSDTDAEQLARLCRRLRPSAHVNLIPLNPTPGYATVGSSPARVRAFRQRLEALGVNATVRQNRGTEIAAACGQLAASGGDGAQPVALTSPGGTGGASSSRPA